MSQAFFPPFLSNAIAALCLLSIGAPALALDPAVGLANTHHTRWTALEGAPLQVTSMAQTPDGWLWFGTYDGLHRFDGNRFERVALAQRGLPTRQQIASVRAQPDGRLLISYVANGLSVRHPDGRLEDLPEIAGPPLTVLVSAIDDDGSIWAGSTGGVHRFDGKAWRRIAFDGVPDAGVPFGMLVDQYGQLWMTDASATWRLDRRQMRFVRVATTGGRLIMSPDGRLWAIRHNRLVLLPGAPDGRVKPRPAWFNQVEARSAALFDRDGTLWALDDAQDIRLRYGAGALRAHAFRAQDGEGDRIARTALSGDDPDYLLEDIEGNVWVVTQQGVDRFREHRVLRSSLPGAGANYSLARDADGVVWAADSRSGALWRLAPGQEPRRERASGVTVVVSDRNGALLLGGKRTIEVRERGATRQIPLPPTRDGRLADLRLIGIRDDGEVLWIASPETGLMGLVSGRWLPREAFTLPDRIFVSAVGGPSQLWLGLGGGELVLYDKGRNQVFDAAAVGLASSIFTEGGIVVSGERGMGVLKDGRLQVLRASEPEVLRNVTGMHLTPEGDRWFNGAAGVLQVRAADWRRSMDDPSEALRYRLFGAQEGYPGTATTETRLPTAVADGQGRIWLAATGGVVSIDSAALARNTHAPHVAILGATAGGVAMPLSAAGTLSLPAGSKEFRIDFTAPGLRRPDGLRFHYRLADVDPDWQDAGNRRTAFYTNVAPGAYRFQVRASNEDGVASANTAALDLKIAPTLVESRLFMALCALGAAALGYCLYRYRVRYLTRRLAERLQVRTAERERIARTLHDTFLQTVQALTLRLDTMVRTLPAGDPTRGKLEQVLDDADQAIAEGRDQLQELRMKDGVVLEQIIGDALGALQAGHPGVAAGLLVSGEGVALAPAVAEEIADIAREAMRNAFRHAGASRIDVRLAYYGRQLALDVADDGRGIEDAVLRAGGRAGHWGLLGMRERAARIGGRLNIDSRAGRGTTVRLVVPLARDTALDAP